MTRSVLAAEKRETARETQNKGSRIGKRWSSTLLLPYTHPKRCALSCRQYKVFSWMFNPESHAPVHCLAKQIALQCSIVP